MKSLFDEPKSSSLQIVFIDNEGRQTYFLSKITHSHHFDRDEVTTQQPTPAAEI